MAIVKIKPIKTRVNTAIKYITNEDKVKRDNQVKNDLIDAIDYIENDYKTSDKKFVSSINCEVCSAYQKMKETKEYYNKTDGILAFHIIQSFDTEEVTPELAHQIGLEFATEIIDDRFECIVATHLNTKHYHNHIIFNSVSFKDGKKFYANRESYAVMRKINDNLCKAYNLKVLSNSKCKSKIDYDKYYKKYEMKNNYKNSTKRDLDLAISQAISFNDFKDLIKKLGYEITNRYGKLSVRELNHKRNIRIERAFGDEYSIESIERRIYDEDNIRIPFIEAFKFKPPKEKHYKTYTKNKVRYKTKSLKSLYHQYCFLLKVYSNNYKKKSRNISQSLKYEIEKMAEYSNQAIFLDKFNINNLEELEKYKDNKINELEDKVKLRKKLWYANKKGKQQENTSIITMQIDEIKKQIEMIENIEERIPKIKDTIHKVKALKEQKNKEREKVIKYEYSK